MYVCYTINKDQSINQYTQCRPVWRQLRAQSSEMLPAADQRPAHPHALTATSEQTSHQSQTLLSVIANHKTSLLYC